MMFMPNGGPNGHPPMMPPSQQAPNQPPPGPPHQRQQQPPSPNTGPRLYPPNMPIIFNPQNPNAPPIHPCGACRREAQADIEDVIKCESGCNFWFHRTCVGLTHEAYVFLRKEPFVEWVCENCFHHRGIPPIKFKSY